ncbi:uncharacterized protein LOC132301603 [Cornus florida]|uniref:uncharacterized protein LOC132301603 n=1 Tax=Cornus florida TaxID=4283 RepID=UPI00289F1E2D|nr:uncharacterized protein LOC132301603 [Cornus florida]
MVRESPSSALGVSNHTTAAHGESPFAMAYGSEVVIPTEAAIPTLRTSLLLEGNNSQQLEHSLDLLDEKRDAAAIRLASYQQQLRNNYNKRVRFRNFAVSDWVLKQETAHVKKLEPNWTRLYRITEAA